MNENIIEKQRQHESELLHDSRILRETFSTTAGIEGLKIIMKLCRDGKQLFPPGAQPTSEAALYFGGRRDVANAINELLRYQPRDEKAVVRTKQGQGQ
jgi:hypothetical protein